MRLLIPTALCLSLAAASAVLAAAAPRDFLSTYEASARSTDPGFGASATRGAAFFTSRHGSDWSCATCHTATPTAIGRHAATGKVIQPLAPSANSARLTDPAKVDKWFRRNCSDVLGRACTPKEKADVVAWLLSIR